MCNPALAVAGAGLALSAYGSVKTANAQKQASQAVATQNLADQAAQNQGFTARAAATGAQTEAQKQAFTAQMGNEQQIADAMRARQGSAFQNQQDTLGVMNQGEEGLRGVGYKAASDLMDRTSGANLGQSQTDWNTQAAKLLEGSNIPALTGANATGGTGDDASTNAALVRRAAEAAANIRAYGSKASQVASYAAPLQLTQNAVQDTQTGIMPAQEASRLLQGGAATMLAPAQTAYGQASSYGNAAMTAAEQAGQANQNIAGLQYGNSTDIANLNQANATTTAANIAEQAKADAEFKAAMGGVISNFGNLGLQGAGYYGNLPGFLKTGANAPFDMSQIP